MFRKDGCGMREESWGVEGGGVREKGVMGEG